MYAACYNHIDVANWAIEEAGANVNYKVNNLNLGDKYPK
jgi:hypothetical protein